MTFLTATYQHTHEKSSHKSIISHFKNYANSYLERPGKQNGDKQRPLRTASLARLALCRMSLVVLVHAHTRKYTERYCKYCRCFNCPLLLLPPVYPTSKSVSREQTTQVSKRFYIFFFTSIGRISSCQSDFTIYPSHVCLHHHINPTKSIKNSLKLTESQGWCDGGKVGNLPSIKARTQICTLDTQRAVLATRYMPKLCRPGRGNMAPAGNCR